MKIHCLSRALAVTCVVVTLASTEGRKAFVSPNLGLRCNRLIFFFTAAQVWNTHNWTCHKEVLGHGDEIWALAVVGDRLISGSIDRYILPP